MRFRESGSNHGRVMQIPCCRTIRLKQRCDHFVPLGLRTSYLLVFLRISIIHVDFFRKFFPAWMINFHVEWRISLVVRPSKLEPRALDAFETQRFRNAASACGSQK